MARTALTVTDVPLNGQVDPVSFDNGDAANDHVLNNDGKTVVILDNDTAGAASVTVVSVADEAGRTGDITVSLASGDTAFVGPFPGRWWNQAGTQDVQINVDAAINIAALSLPGRAL